VLGEIMGDSAAARAGLEVGDRVLEIDGRAIATWDDLVREVRERPEKRVQMRIERDGRKFELAVTPKADKENGKRVGRLGARLFVPKSHVDRIFVEVRHGPLDSVAQATAKTWDISAFSLRMLGRMLLGQVSWKNLSGPVTIADFAGQSAQLGWIPYLTFLALISISLGVLNLLPIPPLDGGHLMFYVIEILKGSPASDRVVEFGQRVGIALLLVLMAFAFYNDLTRLFAG
jgi:regulator of sigma E protease